MSWPKNALLSVATMFLDGLKYNMSDKIRDNLANLCVFV
tara:strand:+ start:426 stop:542 length:117 start_codon:yes stop_codon:yes gene_type:complete